VAGFTAGKLPSSTTAADATGGEAQRFVVGGNVPGRWWELFGSAKLNRLVDEALAANPGLTASQMALLQARENYAAGQAALWTPNINFPRFVGGGGSDTPFDLTTQGDLGISYSIELCCGTDKAQESAAASLRRQEVALKAAYISLTANVINGAISLAVLEERLQTSKDILALQEELVDISRQRLDLGDISPADFAAQQAQLVNTRANIVSIQSSIARQTNQMAGYLGKFPSQMQPIDLRLDDLKLPTSIPVSLPSQLIEQRPDIVQATFSLEAATADAGLAITNMLPQISLSANLSASAMAWDLVGSIVQASVNVGANTHRRAAAEAQLKASAANYQSTVLGAFIDVSNALQAIDYDAQLMALQVESERTSAESLDLARQEFELGTSPYSAVLSAEQSYRNSANSLVQARAQRLTDTVALYVALGGGWWNE